MKTKRILITQNTFIKNLLFSLAILIIPFTASIISKEMKWTLFDYATTGVLIFITLTVLTLTLKVLKTKMQRTLAGIVIFLLFIYVYAELAVGIFTKLGN